MTRTNRGIRTRKLGLVFGGAVAFILGGWISGYTRDYAFLKAGARAAPLIEALDRYTARHHAPPDKLEDLVPEYLGS